MQTTKSPYFVMKATKPKRSAVRACLDIGGGGGSGGSGVKEENGTSAAPKSKRKHIKPEYETNSTNEPVNQKVKSENVKVEDIKSEPDVAPSSTLGTDSLPGWSPTNWVNVYENIRKMREGRTAPVDSMGCERAHDQEASPAVQRFQCLISLMLSSQTKDEVNYAAMTRLRDHGLTVENIINTSEQKVGELIYPVGFWKTKAKYIKEVCPVLKEQYDSDIPRTVKDLCKLKGVGPKMAHICMSAAWKESSGIGVDTHVHRISGRLGWTQKECKTPEATRVALEAWLPRNLWDEVNWMLVGFGQEICRPVGPKCGECLNKDLCPVGRNWVPSPKKKVSPKKAVKKSDQ